MVVRSLAGRDKGRLLAVLEAGEKTVLLSDGKERPAERPKLKNRRHVEPIQKSLSEENLTYNSRLRKALRALEEE